MKFKAFLMGLLLMLLGITASAAEDSYIIKFNDSIQLFNADGTKNNKDYHTVTEDELQDYIDAGVVEYYEPNYKVELFAPTWNLNSVKVDFSQRIGCVGTNVRIGIIDSGIVDGIAPNVIPGYNYIDDNTDTSDTTMHGTWVSSIAASSRFGVALNAQFVPLKCFKDGVDTYISDVLDAIVDAVDVYDCDVINMSFGVIGAVGNATNIRLFKEKIDYAASKGVILVASTGNDYAQTIRYPAAFDNVIGVGSVNELGAWSEFSNYNSSVYVVAPGEKVIGPYVSEGEVSTEHIYQLKGTSFAAPHVSGLAAIAKSINPDITPVEFAKLIADTAVETSADEVEGWDEKYGYGLIDCEAAVRELIKGQIMHISPVWYNNNNTVNTVIYNNTAESKKTLCVCAYYDTGGRMTDCIPAEVEIAADGAYYFPNLRQDGTTKYMVLSNDGVLMPLAVAKEKYNIPTGDSTTGGSTTGSSTTGGTTTSEL